MEYAKFFREFATDFAKFCMILEKIHEISIRPLLIMGTIQIRFLRHLVLISDPHNIRLAGSENPPGSGC